MLNKAGWQDRACSPAETYDRVSSFLPEFGITRVARHTGLDRIGIPVWCAYTPNAKSIVVAQGKGLTDEDARTSAVMEALERVVASQPHCDVTRASAGQLRSSGKRVDTLANLIAAGQPAVSDDETIPWIGGRDLLTGETVYVPFEATILDRTVTERRYWQSSDGLASGNTLDEAMFHGLNERIERDAYTLWQVSSFKARQASCLDPKSLGFPEIALLTARIEKAGLVSRLFDMTSDAGIPSFVAFVAPGEVLSSQRPRFADVNYGAGTHPSARKAIVRAITEAAQSRMTYISGARDDIYPSVYRQPLAEEARGLLLTDPKMRQLQDFADMAGGGLRETVEVFREKALGPVIAVSLSDPAWPFAVAKVFAPALENPEGARAQRYGPRALARGSFG
jgi:ribosomal protein S12 methylthiotransferase accessory factor